MDDTIILKNEIILLDVGRGKRDETAWGDFFFFFFIGIKCP